MINENNIQDQNKTVKNMTNIKSKVACNVNNADNIHYQNEMTLP